MSGSFAFLGDYGYLLAYNGKITFAAELLALLLGVPWLLLGHVFGEMIFIGLTCYEDNSDNDREWLARADGYIAVIGLTWLVVLFLVIFGYPVIRAFLHIGEGVLSSTALLSSIATAFLAWSKASPAGPAPPNKSTGFFSANMLLAIAAPVCVISLVIGASALTDWILFGGTY